MDECSLDLIGTARSFGFLVGEALFFFQKIKLDFLRHYLTSIMISA